MTTKRDSDIAIGIVNFRTKRILEKCLKTIPLQKTKYSYTLYVYNNSPEENLSDLLNDYNGVFSHTYQKNVGFCKGHNDILRASKSTYYLCLNPDVLLENTYIEECVNVLEQDASIGAVTGKLLWYDSKNSIKTNIIDSTGIVRNGILRFFDRGQGEKDIGQFDKLPNVFGVSGAAAIYRRKTLENVKDVHGYFDERFFAYKEDVDLSFRLQEKGWKSRYVPTAVGYHVRGTKLVKNDATFFKRLLHKKNISFKTTLYTFRNILLLLLKHNL